MKRTVVVMLLALVAAPAITACGTSDEEKREQARQEAAEKRAAKERKERARQQAAHDACASTYSDLQDAVREMNSRISVGLTYANYSTEVADVRVAYDTTDFGDEDDIDCLSTVGLPLEQALNQYVKAGNRWDECFEDIYCENDSIEAELQAHWAKASRFLDRSTSALDRMAPTN